jgi:histidine triad (HIT) family protein
MNCATPWLNPLSKVKSNPCIFCQIIAGEASEHPQGREAPANIVYRDEQLIAFDDIHRIAPVHILLAPTRHITSLNDVEDADQVWLGRMLLLARRLAQQAGIHQAGYRLQLNTGRAGGQSVFHLHMHLIGGKPLTRDNT